MENNKNIKKTVSLIFSPLSPWALTEVFERRGMQTQTTKIPQKRKKGSQYREKSLHIEKRSPYGEKKASHIE